MNYIKEGLIILDDKKREYTVLNVIGKGGFGIVFKIKRNSNNEIYALKTLNIGSFQKEYLDSFRHECEAAIEINHDNVINYHFFQSKELPPFIIMDFAEGGSLKNFIEKQKLNGFVESSYLQTIFLQLIDGMNEINKTFIHRDLKPDNILLQNNKFKITDFGLSKVLEDDTRTSTFKGSGTYSYMSPEAWNLESNTLLMDIYSMGFVFYELATLQHPFNNEETKGYDDWKQLHLYKNPRLVNEINPNLSPIITQLIQKMISKIPSSRFQNWDEIKTFLDKDYLPKTIHSNTIDNILRKKAKEKSKEIQVELEQKSKEELKRKKKELVEYVFDKKITIPLRKFIDELNSQLIGDKILLSEHPLKNYIRFNNGNNFSIECSVIFEENFLRETPYEWMGEHKYKSELRLPTLKTDKIIAWGIIKTSSQKGYNFVLVEEENNPYGKLILLTNTNNALSRKYRSPEPFYFEYSELEKEITFINAMHIYNMKDELFCFEKISELITNEI